MKTYCSAPFRQIYADNASRYRLCCHASKNNDLAKYNTNNTAPFKYFLSEEMENVRIKLLSGERVQGCEPCYKLEDRGFKSWRQWKYNKIYPMTANVEKVSLKLRILGSYCNLGCYMCHPYNSSTRRVELAKSDIKLTDFTKVQEKQVNISTKRYDETVQDILDNIELVDHMHITGGEPLLLPRMYQMMERIPDEHAKNIQLSFDTNLTELEFKEWNIWQLVDRFKKIALGVSCDHFGDKLSWIRYPIDIHQFEKNLQTAKSIIANVNVTVSLLNINELDEIRDYYKDFNVTFTGIVDNPKILSIRNLPQKLKNEYKEKYKNYEMLIQELDKAVIPGELERGFEYCKKLNTRRNINFDHVFKDLLDKIQNTFTL
jgi:MoaA/NifB/PqqE/SkfB family radical SAM enzyme